MADFCLQKHKTVRSKLGQYRRCPGTSSKSTSLCRLDVVVKGQTLCEHGLSETKRQPLVARKVSTLVQKIKFFIAVNLIVQS